MKAQQLICPRCGTKFVIDTKKASKLEQCPHCHKQMALCPDSQKKIKYIRYLIMVGIGLLFSYAMMDFEKTNNIIMVALVCVVGFILMRYIDTICFKLAFIFFSFKYMDIDEYAKIRKPTLGERKKKK